MPKRKKHPAPYPLPQGVRTLREIHGMSKVERAKLPCISCGQPIGHGDWKIPVCQKCRAAKAHADQK